MTTRARPGRRLTGIGALRLAAFLLLAGGAALSRGKGSGPLEPEEALASFQLEDGFRVELVASEPLVSDPVAMEIDEHGRIYVVEMHGYPLDTGGSGRVVLLHDTDGDGRADRSTAFAEGLRLPTGIMRWKRGVLVTDSPEVWYLEDSDGDGRADVRRAVLTGFALTNPQHTTNTPLYGLDNWIYLANEGPVRTVRYPREFGDAGSEVRFPDAPGSPVLPPDAGGRNVRFRPDTRGLEMLAARSQFGHTFDPWGRHFLVTNNRHAYHEVVSARYLSRNPRLQVSSVVQDLPDYGVPAEVFPVTDRPEHQLLTDVGVMTSASGLTYYQGGLFPAAYRDAIFVAESAHNLVHAARVREEGASFRASRLREGREFMASTDSWFRPVNFYVGPDGALYVIDYYRKIIEHPEWLDDATIAAGELSAGRDRGRIYRVVPAGAPSSFPAGGPLPGNAAPAELVRMLEHPNLWWRRHAQRLLVDGAPPEATLPLQRLAAESASDVGRAHALWTLEGMGRLAPDVIRRALADGSPGVRENAIRLAELHLARSPSLADALLGMVDDPGARVRFQLLLTLGDLSTPAAEAARDTLLVRGLEDGWMQVGALSAAGTDAGRLFRSMLARLAERETPGRRALFTRLGTMMGAAGWTAATRATLEAAAGATAPASAWWRAATLEGLAAGLRGRPVQGDAWDADRALLLGMLADDEPAPVRAAALQLLEILGLPGGAHAAAAVGRAARLVEDRRADAGARVDAVRLLALHDPAAHRESLRAATAAGEPAPVQVAAVRALGQSGGEETASFFLERWPQWSPAVRDEAVRVLARDAARMRRLVEAVEAGRIRASEIDRPLRIRLMMAEDEALRARARALFAASADAGEVVERYAAALSLPASAERGRQVFARACSACHRYRGAGGADFGPDLGALRNRPPRALLADILQPNRSIADGYELWVVERADGGSVAGVIAGETPTSVTLRGAGGAEIVVPRAEIRAMSIAELSAMPEGLEAQIEAREMADLIAFLRGGP